MLSLVIPVFKNERSIPDLVEAVGELARCLPGGFEAIFVDDGGPDRSRQLLANLLPSAGFRARLVMLSRNFGSFAAIRAGLAEGSGDYFAVMSADLQEPTTIVTEFLRLLEGQMHDVVVGTREQRVDPLLSRVASSLFWRIYRLAVQRDVPAGGVDVFGCTRAFRDEVLALSERNSTLVGLIFWLGCRRAEIKYSRLPRRHGVSAWSFWRKVRYLLDSTFAFSDLPIRLLSLAGISGMGVSLLLAAVVLAARIRGNVQVPGYTATVLVVMFFGGLNSFGIGVLGEYLWRTFENTKRRPDYVVLKTENYGA
ncbi:MAG: glycosyltransferase family 2 protein [Acidobacteriota bacterium]